MTRDPDETAGSGVPRLRILMVHNLLEEKGGAETFFLREVEVLRRAGHEVFTFGFGEEDGGDEAGAMLQVGEPRRMWLRKLFKFTFHPAAYRALRRFVRTVDPDLVHLHMDTKYPLTVLAALRGRPVIQMFHGGTLLCPTGWLVHADDEEPCEGGAGLKCVRHGCLPAYELPLHVALQRVWQASARRVVTHFTPPSRYLTDYLKRFGFPRVTRLPYFSPVGLPSEPPPPSRSRTILFTGVLTHQKGVEYLVRAVPQVIERHPDAAFVIVGDGHLDQTLRDLARTLGVDGSITFTGRLPNQALEHYYGSARATVIPSMWLENSPLVAYEAMLAGRPIVGSARGGIPDLIEAADCGFVVPPKDPAAIAEALVRLLDDADLADRLGANGRRHAIESLSEEAFLSRFHEVVAATPGVRAANGGRVAPA